VERKREQEQWKLVWWRQGAVGVVEGSRAAGAGVVEEGGLVVIGTEGSKRAGVERARDERQQTRKAI
jgi:hypothetical protein